MTEVRDNPEKSRYELLEDGERLLGVADYRPMGDTLAFPHTEIVPARRNQGLGARTGPGSARRRPSQGRQGRRRCAGSWPSSWRSNPEYADLRA